MKTFVIAIVAACSMMLHAQQAIDAVGARKGIWSTDFPAIQKAAADSKGNVFLLFTGSDWCGWCKLMDRLVFSQKEWQDFAAKHLYLAYIDFPRDTSKITEAVHNQNVRLRENYNVDGYPTMIIIDHEGTVLGKLGASREATPASFIAEIQKILFFTPAKYEEITEQMTPEQRDAMKANEEKKAQLKTEINTAIQTATEQPNEENLKKLGDLVKTWYTTPDMYTSAILFILEKKSPELKKSFQETTLKMAEVTTELIVADVKFAKAENKDEKAVEAHQKAQEKRLPELVQLKKKLDELVIKAIQP